MTAPSDNLRQACKAWAKRFALRDDGEDLVACVQAQREDAAREALEKAAQIALGMTGPGNTVAQAQGYSAACCDIREAIRALIPPAKEPAPTR